MLLRIWLIRLLEQTQRVHISMKENKCYLTIFSWSQAEETHSFPHTEQLTEGIKFLLSEIWLITMQMKPHSLWIRHTVQLQPIITEADASALINIRTERAREDLEVDAEMQYTSQKKWKEEGTVLIWQSEWLHIRNTAITHEDEKSERRRRETRRGKDICSQGEIGKNQVVFIPICLCFPVLYILF